MSRRREVAVAGRLDGSLGGDDDGDREHEQQQLGVAARRIPQRFHRCRHRQFRSVDGRARAGRRAGPGVDRRRAATCDRRDDEVVDRVDRGGQRRASAARPSRGRRRGRRHRGRLPIRSSMSSAWSRTRTPTARRRLVRPARRFHLAVQPADDPPRVVLVAGRDARDDLITRRGREVGQLDVGVLVHLGELDRAERGVDAAVDRDLAAGAADVVLRLRPRVGAAEAATDEHAAR